jgi:DNA-binding NarL/FixJ family response regulator
MRFRKSTHGTCRTIVVQPEPAVRRALSFWIDRQPGFRCVGEYSSLEPLLGSLSLHQIGLLLVDRELLEGPQGTPLEWIRQQWPRVKTFPFGIYEESNYIFHSVTGVKSGYMLCRRPVSRLLEPVRSLAHNPEIQWNRLVREIHGHFRTLFGEEESGYEPKSAARLTPREHDVLLALARGLNEKEVAESLGISGQTVHNHVKNAYHKLNAHSRTEAVLKYLGH